MTPATNNTVAAALAAPDNAAAPDFSGMEKYNPVSRAAAMGTYVPQSMAYETRQALLRLQMLVGGNVDVYVTQKLKYPDVATLHGYFAAEQVDALALAIFNIETGEGMVIGDQTGIGKGRIAGGVIRYGCVNNLPTIFITEKPTLFSDFYRDLYDIGSIDLVPLIINTDPAATLQINLDAETIVKVHEHLGNDKYKPKTLLELKSLLSEYTDDNLPFTYAEDYLDQGNRTLLPPGYNFVMATYSQMSDDLVSKQMMKGDGVNVKVPDKPGPSQFKTSFMANYARGAVVVLDEAHNASGGASATGYYINYGILGRCKGCCYLSATFAKRPDNMGVYATKTAIKHTGLSAIKLAEAFLKGGVALQEIVASQLVASGQMLRRQRTFEGIEVAYNYLPERYEEHKALYNKVIRLVTAIIEFEREYVAPFLEEMSESLGYGGDKADKTKGTKDGGVNNSPFFNKTHHVIRQLLFSVKAQDVAREAVKMLNENLKVVIAFSSTMESFVNELSLTDGDIVENADFSLVLKKSLENALRYTVSSGNTMNGDYKAEHYTLTESDFGSDGASILAGLKAEIENASTGIMLSPIDTLINEIEKVRKPEYIGGDKQEYYKVRECTGRKGQMKEEDGQLVYRSFKANVKQFFAEFNSGACDVLLINQSASTGVSAHSSGKVKDQRQRAMIIHQPELDINTEVQKRGRINRTGQVNKPKYLYVSSSIPAEKRIFMVLKRKLKSLDANTTGNQRSSQQVLDTEDFFNKYGNKVVRTFLDENITIALALDMAASQNADKETDSRAMVSDEVAETFSRRIALLPVELQETSYTDVTERYGEFVNDLKARGEYDLEVEYLDLQAQTTDRTILTVGGGQPSAFGRHAVMETVNARVLRRPMKWSEVEKQIETALNGKSPETLQTEMIFEYESGRVQLFNERTAKIEKEIAAIQERLNKPTKKDNTEEGIEKLNKKLEVLQDDKTLLKVKLDGEKNTGKRMLEFYRIGRPFVFKREERQYSAVVTNVYFAKPAGDTNRYNHPNIRVACAVYGPDRSATLKLNDTVTLSALLVTESTASQFLDDVLYNWNRMEVKDDKRERRQIISNNVLLGIAGAPANGKLIKFSQDNGAIRSGILLEADRTRSGDTIVAPAKTKQPVTGLYDEIIRSRPNSERFFVGGNTMKNSISFEKTYSSDIHIVVPGTGAYKKFWGDQDLIDLLSVSYAGAEKKFTTYSGNLFQAKISQDNLKIFLQILWDKHQVTYEGNPIPYSETDDAPLPDNYIEVEIVATAPNDGGAAVDLVENEIQRMIEMIKLELA